MSFNLTTIYRLSSVYFIVFACFLLSLIPILPIAFIKSISFIALLSFIYFIFLFINSSGIFTICITIYPIFQILWVTVSVFIIEQGFYISEQFKYGFPTGATARLCFYSVLFFSAIKLSMLIMNFFNKNSLRSFYHSSFIDFTFAYLFGISIISLLIIYGVFNGFPLALSIDRFSYWDGGAITQLFRRLTYMVPMIGFFIFFTGVQKNIIGKLIIFSCFPILFLFGDKFSGLLDVILYSLMGYLSNKIISGDFKIEWFNILKYLTIPIVFICIFAIYGYVVWHDTSEFGLFESVLSRIFVLQGHVYFGIDYYMTTSISNSAVMDIFRIDNINHPSGLPELMYVISPDDFVYNMRELGIRFTMGGFAVILYKTSFLGVIPFIILAGIFSGIFFYILIDQLKRKDFVGILFSLIFFNSAYANAFLMGEYYYLYKPIALMYYLYIIIYFLLRFISHNLKLQAAS